ncbi:MAG: acyltransferase [Bacteroidaceae bacterium]|nr:acyltransferase [Bacteroidaceae bacterium]
MEKVQPFSSEQLQSKVISFLRFPLIVAVVLIHTQIGTVNGVVGNLETPLPFGGAFPLYESTLYLFVQVLARIAVPLFFLFSGFLFFYKTNGFTIENYADKLKKRVRTLLIPYLFWNILFIVFYYISMTLFPGATEYIIGKSYTIKEWLLTLWDSNNTGCPISFQFWFIRDLMIVVLFTPLIHLLTKKFGCLLPLLLGILWLMGLSFKTVGFSINAFFFFTLGAYFSITRRNFVELVKPRVVFLGILYLLLVIIVFCTKSYDWVMYVKRASILLGIVFAIAVSAVYIAKGKWKVNTFLAESSFFIFAYHIIAIPIIRRVLLFIIPCTTDLRATILYFLLAAIAIIIGLILYYFLKKWFPKTTALITGGR